MGRGDEVGMAKQNVRLGRLFDKDVKGRAANMAAVQTGPQSRLVNKAAARAVDDEHALAGLGEVFGAQDVAGLVGQGGVQGDDLGAGQQLVQLDLFHADLDGPFGRQERIIGNDLHLQAVSAVGDNAADVAAAD